MERVGTTESRQTPAAADRAVARGSGVPKAERVSLKNFEVFQPRLAAEPNRWYSTRVHQKGIFQGDFYGQNYGAKEIVQPGIGREIPSARHTQRTLSVF